MHGGYFSPIKYTFSITDLWGIYRFICAEIISVAYSPAQSVGATKGLLVGLLFRVFSG